MEVLKYLAARLNEASTYSAIAVMCGLLHVNVDPGTMHTAALWGGVVAAILGVLISEVGKKPAPGVAADVMQAVVSAIRNPTTESTPNA